MYIGEAKRLSDQFLMQLQSTKYQLCVYIQCSNKSVQVIFGFRNYETFKSFNIRRNINDFVTWLITHYCQILNQSSLEVTLKKNQKGIYLPYKSTLRYCWLPIILKSVTTIQICPNTCPDYAFRRTLPGFIIYPYILLRRKNVVINV